MTSTGAHPTTSHYLVFILFILETNRTERYVFPICLFFEAIALATKLKLFQRGIDSEELSLMLWFS